MKPFHFSPSCICPEEKPVQQRQEQAVGCRCHDWHRGNKAGCSGLQPLPTTWGSLDLALLSLGSWTSSDPPNIPYLEPRRESPVLLKLRASMRMHVSPRPTPRLPQSSLRGRQYICTDLIWGAAMYKRKGRRRRGSRTQSISPGSRCGCRSSSVTPQLCSPTAASPPRHASVNCDSPGSRAFWEM